jgi:hypothetical protein
MANQPVKSPPEKNVGMYVVAAAAVGTLLYFALKKSIPTPPPSTKGTVKFFSTPVESTVYVDDVMKGKTPLTLTLEKGNHTWKTVMDGNPDVSKIGSFVLAAGEIKTIQANYNLAEELSFDLLQPIYAPTDIYQGTNVTVTCPVKSTSNVATVVKGVIELHYGSILPGPGDLIIKKDIPQFTIAPGETRNMQTSWTEIAPADGRRDIIVKIQKPTGVELASNHFDDAYTVKSNDINIGDALIKVGVSYSNLQIGQYMKATVKFTNVTSQTVTPTFRLSFKSNVPLLWNLNWNTWQGDDTPFINFGSVAPSATKTVVINCTTKLPADWTPGTSMSAQVELDGVNGPWDLKEDLVLGAPDLPPPDYDPKFTKANVPTGTKEFSYAVSGFVPNTDIWIGIVNGGGLTDRTNSQGICYGSMMLSEPNGDYTVVAEQYYGGEGFKALSTITINISGNVTSEVFAYLDANNDLHYHFYGFAPLNPQIRLEVEGGGYWIHPLPSQHDGSGSGIMHVTEPYGTLRVSDPFGNEAEVYFYAYDSGY